MSSTSAIKQTIHFLNNRSDRSYILWGSLFILAFALVSIVYISYGGSHIMAPWDVFILLDGGWRIFTGQIPHTDFYNPIGPLSYLLTSIGMSVSSPSLTSIVIGNAILLAVLAPICWLVAGSRLSGFNAFLFSLFILFLVVAPRPLGYDIKTTTYAMIYNRQGYALYSLLLLGLFLVPRRTLRNYPFIDGVIQGVLLGLLFFCKSTFFVMGVAALLLTLLFPPRIKETLMGQISGFAFVCLSMSVVFHVSIPNYIIDILSSGGAQSWSYRFSRLESSLMDNLMIMYLIYLLFAVSLALTSGSKRIKNSFHEKLRFFMILSFVLVSALVLTSTNADEGIDIPVIYVSGVILIDYLSRFLYREDESRLTAFEFNYLFAILIIIPISFGNIIIKDSLSFSYSVFWKEFRLSRVAETQRFQSENLRDFIIPETSWWKTAYWRAKDMPSRINEGISLLEGHVSDESKIFTFALTNPFSIALGLPSPLGAPLWWDLDISFNREKYPKPEKIFYETDLIMIPKLRPEDDGCCKETVVQMREVYGDYLKDNFCEAEQSESWILLTKCD